MRLQCSKSDATKIIIRNASASKITFLQMLFHRPLGVETLKGETLKPFSPFSILDNFHYLIVFYSIQSLKHRLKEKIIALA